MPKELSSSSSDDDIEEIEQYSIKKKQEVKKKPVKKAESESDSDTDSSSEDEPVPEEFKKSVVDWVTADNKQKELQAVTKQLNATKKKLQPIIIKYLTSMDKSAIAITGGKIKLNKATSQVALKKEHIINELTKKLKDKHKAEQWTEDIYDSRPEVTRANLKRTKGKK